MSFASYTDRIEAAVQKAEDGSEILNIVANGDEFTEVPTTSGPVPSLKKWQKDNMDLISGGVIARVDKAILSYPDYASASAAAATLPDGQVVKIAEDETRGGLATIYAVASGALVFSRYGNNYLTKSVEGFGAVGDGVVDDTAALQSAFNSGVPVRLTDGRIYRVSRLTIPDDAVILGRGVLRFDGTTGPTNDHQLTVGARVYIECLNWRSPGTETNFYTAVFLGNETTVGEIDMRSDVERVGTEGIWFKGSRVRVGNIVTKNIIRPVAFFNYDSALDAPQEDIRVGNIDVERYTRALVINNCKNIRVGNVIAKVRSSTASKSPGHNGALFQSIQDAEFGDFRIENAGEHAVRIGGTVDGGGETKNVKFGVITAVESGGCAFKIAPTPPEITSNVTVVGVNGIDVGDGVVGGGNDECVRLTSFKNVCIGWIKNTHSKYSNSKCPLRINSGDGLWVGSINTVNGTLAMQIVEDSDSGTGNLSNVFIDNLNGTLVGPDGIGVLYGTGGRTLSNINIEGINLTGITRDFVVFSAGVTLTGPMTITGVVNGTTTPTFINKPASDNLYIDIRFNRYRAVGHNSAAAFGYGHILSGRPADIGNTPAWYGDFAVSNHLVTPGAGAYGGGYFWTRNGSTRRAAAIVSKQITADDKENGLAFLVQDNSSTANESLQERMLLKHNGTLMLNNLAVFANNAAAITGGLVAGDIYKTATGEIRIVV